MTRPVVKRRRPIMQRNAHLLPPPQVLIAVRVQDPNDLYDKFRNSGALKLIGTMDYTNADEWIVQVEKIFIVFQ